MLNGLVGRARGRCALVIALLSFAVLVSAAPASAGIEGTYSKEGHGHLVVAHTDSGAPAITEFFANFGRCSYSLRGGDVPIHDGRAVFIAQTPFIGRWNIHVSFARAAVARVEIVSTTGSSLCPSGYHRIDEHQHG